MSQGSDDRRLLAALRHSVDTVIVIDGAGTLQLVSPSGPEVFGYDPEMVLGLNALDLVHPDDVVLAIEALTSTATKSGRMEPLHLRIQDGTGRWRPVTLVAVNRLDDPEVRGIVLTVRDQTGMAEMDRMLAERDDRYRQIVEMAAEGVWILDESDHTSFVTGRMAAMLGVSVEDMIGRPVFDFMDDDAAADAADLLERRRLGISENHPFRLRHADGHPVWVRISATPVFDHEGTYRGAIGMVTDLSDLHHQQEMLAAAEATHRAVLEALPDLVFRMSADGRYLDVHAGDPLDLAAPPEVFLGRTVTEVLGNELGGRVLRAIGSTLATGRTETLEYELDLECGPAAFEARISRVNDDEVVTVVRNVTALRLAGSASPA
jgi:PAS domain S-box-containing protein